MNPAVRVTVLVCASKLSCFLFFVLIGGKFPRRWWFKVWPQLGKGAAMRCLIWELYNKECFAFLAQIKQIICSRCASFYDFHAHCWGTTMHWFWMFCGQEGLGRQFTGQIEGGCGVGNSYIGMKDISSRRHLVISCLRLQKQASQSATLELGKLPNHSRA